MCRGVLASVRPPRARLWVLAVVTFGVGDVATTTAGLELGGLVEAGPVTRPLVRRYGLAAMGLAKLLAFGLCYALWLVVPPPHRLGIPLGLVLLGVVVTVWNVTLTLLALVA